VGESSKLPNAAARDVYLRALQQKWPDVLHALQDDVFSRLVELWPDRLAADLSLYSAKFRQFDEAFGDKTLDRALRLWAKSFSIEDKWMLQSARATMYMYGVSWRDPQLPWTGWSNAGPQHLTLRPTFDLNISDCWMPPEFGGSETWDTFSDRMRSEFNYGLARYRKRQSEHFGVLKDNAERDARWTVRYQKGELATEIAETLSGPYEDSSQAVWKAIDRFAKDIGLTLRKARRHRTGK